MPEHTETGMRGASLSTTQTSHTSTTENIVGRVREQATSQLNTQKNKATDGLGTVAHAVRETTTRLRADNHDTVARYAEQAADQIERFSERLKNKDVGELLNDAQRLARQKPALFVGGAFALGLLGARFMKSSAQADNDYSASREYTRGFDATSARPSSVGAVPTSNAYGNRVPPSATAAASVPSRTRRSSTASRERDYPPTEGL
jgi:hypothetical protein